MDPVVTIEQKHICSEPEPVIFNVRPGGHIRGIHSDQFADAFAALGCAPQKRASVVDPIETGPNARQWFVDMHPLGEEEYGYCLWPPLPTRAAALAAEREHILANWLKPQGHSNAKDQKQDDPPRDAPECPPHADTHAAH